MSKIFVITGTRKGIGKNISEYYLQKGHIVTGCSRGESTIAHDNYYHYRLDVADEKAVIHMVNDIRNMFGRIEILINNAGTASMNHIITTPYKTAQNIFSTNMFGTFLFTREVSKVMIKHKFGRIVNFTSVAASLRLEGEAIYAASKAAIVNFTEITAKELADFGITVNAVGPTPIQTDLIRNVPDEKLANLIKQQAIKRLGEFEDIINVIDLFISERSGFITGQVIYLGGVNQ